ncbi:MAG TPA: T9SS type A sorting domain-containing protein, partial [Chitinophagaceae bacterium]
SLSIVTTPLVTSNFMIVTVSEYQESYPLTIVDATASRNFTLGKSVVTSGGSLVGIYYLTNPGTGIHIINISSGTGNNANMKAIVSYYSGVDTQNPIANSASNKNPLGSMDNDPHLNITSAPGQMVVDALTYERPVSALTGDPSQITNAYINSNGWNNGSSHKPGATNVSMAWDYSQDIGSYWGIVALSLKAQPSNPLPIVLTDFWAQYKKPNVTLYWKTSQEINFSHFVIERSTEGTNYTDAGVVFAYGNAVDNTNYSFSDNLNNIQSGIVYYRLRSVDIDGKSQYSEIRIIRISKQTENAIGIVAFPNPVINEVRISIPGEWQNKKVTYEVLNANGQVAKRTEAGCSSQTETVNMSTLARGFYLVRVSCEGQTAQQKIVK